MASADEPGSAVLQYQKSSESTDAKEKVSSMIARCTPDEIALGMASADEPGSTVHKYPKYPTKSWIINAKEKIYSKNTEIASEIIDSDDTKLQAMETKQNAILEQGTAHNCSIVTADSSKTTMTKEVIPDIAISNTTTKYETVTACEAINMDTGKGSDKVTDIRATKFISKVSF